MFDFPDSDPSHDDDDSDPAEVARLSAGVVLPNPTNLPWWTDGQSAEGWPWTSTAVICDNTLDEDGFPTGPEHEDDYGSDPRCSQGPGAWQRLWDLVDSLRLMATSRRYPAGQFMSTADARTLASLANTLSDAVWARLADRPIGNGQFWPAATTDDAAAQVLAILGRSLANVGADRIGADPF